MIFVTGGTGLLGSHLLYALTSQGGNVRALKGSRDGSEALRRVFSFYSEQPDALLGRIEWVSADLSDYYSLMEALEGVTTVYHCAAIVSFHNKDKEKLMAVNSAGTENLVNAALDKGIKKFCHVSSIATLGRTENGELITEQNFWKSSPSNSVYSISKYSAEREVWRAAEEGLNVVIVNPSLIIGPGHWSQSSTSIISKAAKGIKFYTEGVNGFVDVRDVAALMIRLMQSEITNERFILSAENLPFRNLVDMIQLNFGHRPSPLPAGRIMSGLAWRLEKMRSLFTGSAPLITKETAQSAHKVNCFSNQKILSAFPDFNFIPVKKSIADTVEIFRREHQS